MKISRYIKLLFLFVFTLSIAANAQTGKRGSVNVEEWHEQKWNFMVNEIGLSPAEAELIKPIFMDYENKNWQLHMQLREFFHKSRSKKMTDEDFAQINTQMINIEIKKMKYLREYHMKLVGLLKPETLFKYYEAQKTYEPQLLKQGRGQRGKRQ